MVENSGACAAASAQAGILDYTASLHATVCGGLPPNANRMQDPDGHIMLHESCNMAGSLKKVLQGNRI
jgi:hypothetical protein